MERDLAQGALVGYPFYGHGQVLVTVESERLALNGTADGEGPDDRMAYVPWSAPPFSTEKHLSRSSKLQQPFRKTLSSFRVTLTGGIDGRNVKTVRNLQPPRFSSLP
jgi:hypothetical protein